MDLEKVVSTLSKKDLHLIEGYHTINSQLYYFKAYTIGDPQNIIRIDLKESEGRKIKDE